MGTNTQSDLEPRDIHQVLSNERRRMVLTILREGTGESTARELSERIAVMETEQDPPPRNIRQSAYVSLHQTHLPKLNDLGIVDYDESAKTVTLTDRARQVGVYMETVPRYGISWSEFYVAASVIGLLLVVASRIGVPVLASLDASVWATGVLLLVAASATYQTRKQGTTIFHRLAEKRRSE